MASPRSLLDRLEFPQADSRRDLPGNPDQVIDAICNHLQILLNTRQGGALTAPDFGISDFSEISRGNQSMSRLQEEIRKSIEKYEPRLAEVQVSFYTREDQPFTLHFDIHAKVVASDRRPATVFQSTIETSGEVRVHRKD